MKSWSLSAATGTPTLGRLLDVEQITRTLAFLAGYRPAIVGAAPDDDAACEAPRPPMDGRMAREDGPEPYCTACGRAGGIGPALNSETLALQLVESHHAVFRP